jgi:hypothetical protein
LASGVNKSVPPFCDLLIPHLQEHLLHVGEPQLAGIVLPERVQLARGDP